MATKKTPAKKKADTESNTGKELQPWEQELADLAEEAAASASSTGGGSKSIGTRGGQFSIDGAPVEGNTLEAVVLDFLVDVTYYEDDYDPDDVTPPTAFALGRNEKELVWHENSHPDYAGEELKDSPPFQWNSAEKGKGKAAKSKRRLLLIDSADLEDDIAAAEVRKLMVPVTSGKAWDAYVKQIKVHGKPPCAVLTEITINSHPKYQFTLSFKMLGTIEDEHMPEVLAKRRSIQDELFTPYSKWDDAGEEEEEAKPSKALAKGRGKPAKPAKRGRR